MVHCADALVRAKPVMPAKRQVPMKIGSQEHRDAFCRHFTQTYSEYDPNTLPWPVLDDEALHRLRSVPFWEEVFYTERRAGAIVAAFTETVADPVLREALALQGREETRHIVFFINWMAYTEARQGWFARTILPLTSLHYYLRAMGRMAGLARRGKEL